MFAGPRGDRRRRRSAHVAGHVDHEPEPTGFTVTTLVLLALVVAATRTRRSA